MQMSIDFNTATAEDAAEPKSVPHISALTTEPAARRPLSNFEQRQLDRADRYRKQANKARMESNTAAARAMQLASHIPMGQPILVGHHSEGRHRRDLARIDSGIRKAVEADNLASSLESRAAAIEANTAIFSDDPDATEKLADKITRLEKKQELMREANKAIRAGNDGRLREMGFSDVKIEGLKKGDFCGRIGYPDYTLANNNAEIRRCKERLKLIETRQGQESSETALDCGVTIRDNVEANRVQILFPGKPSEAIRAKLKSNGFRWCRTAGAWQRHRGSWALLMAKEIVKAYGAEGGE